MALNAEKWQLVPTWASPEDPSALLAKEADNWFSPSGAKMMPNVVYCNHIVRPDDTYSVVFDGASLYSHGPPGPAGAGAVLTHEKSGAQFAEIRLPVGTATYEQAEYWSLLAALLVAKENGIKHIAAAGDSLLVVQQVSGKGGWCKNPELEALRNMIVGVAAVHFNSLYVRHRQQACCGRVYTLAKEAIAMPFLLRDR